MTYTLPGVAHTLPGVSQADAPEEHRGPARSARASRAGGSPQRDGLYVCAPLIHALWQKLFEAIRLGSKHKRQKEKLLRTVVLEAEGKSSNRNTV